MADRAFPEIPLPPEPWPPTVELVVRREPLAAIRELLGISIHAVVNEPRQARIVYELYRITRRIEREAWLRRELERMRVQAWIAAHL